jgi:hypothetical protein
MGIGGGNVGFDMYTSKLGEGHQIEHVWNQLDGGIYGSKRRYYL